MVISKRKRKANRANSKRSTGPRTAEGKRATGANAVRHGLCSSNAVIANESLEEYEALRADYLQRFGPRDLVELNLVDRMVHAQWNLVRSQTIENETVNITMLEMAPDLAKRYDGLPEAGRLAQAYEKLSKTPFLTLVLRYAARHSAEYCRALRELMEMRKNLPLAPPGTPEVANYQTKPIPKSDTPAPGCLVQPPDNERTHETAECAVGGSRRAPV